MPKSKTTKKSATKKSKNNLNETGLRKGEDRRQDEMDVDADGQPIAKKRKTKRRRQIDPTTCEREYSDPEIEFMRAMDEYKRCSGRMFPTCSEILEVISKLGYRQIAESQTIYDPNENSPPQEVGGLDEEGSEEIDEQLV